MKVGNHTMSTAQQQSQRIEALFTRFDSLKSRVEEFKNAYMTQANPTVQTVQEPVQFVEPTISERFEAVQEESAQVNDLVENINIDALLNDLNLDTQIQQTQVVSEPTPEPQVDNSIGDIDIDAMLNSMSFDDLQI